MRDLMIIASTLLASSVVVAHPRMEFDIPQDKIEELQRRQSDTSTRTPGYDYTGDTKDFLSGRCTNAQIRDVLFGWAEAGYYADALSQWDPTSTSPDKYNDAFNLYMGTQTSTSTTRLQGNIGRANALHAGGGNGNTYFWIYCDEAVTTTPPECSADTWAYAWNDEGTTQSNHYITACPKYFNTPQTPTLASKLARLRAGTLDKRDVQNFVDTKGSVIFHETTHWSTAVGIPMIYDFIPPNENTKIYGARTVRTSATNNGAEGNSQIAEAYEVAGSALLGMELFGLAVPPLPQGENSKRKHRRQDDPVAAPGDGTDVDVIPADTEDDNPSQDMLGPPTGWTPPDDPNRAGFQATIVDWNPNQGGPNDAQPNPAAWYRCTGSQATINRADYLPIRQTNGKGSPSSSSSGSSSATTSTASGSSSSAGTASSTSTFSTLVPYGNSTATASKSSSAPTGSSSPSSSSSGGSSTGGNGGSSGSSGPSGSGSGSSSSGSGSSSPGSSSGSSGSSSGSSSSSSNSGGSGSGSASGTSSTSNSGSSSAGSSSSGSGSGTSSGISGSGSSSSGSGGSSSAGSTINCPAGFICSCDIRKA